MKLLELSESADGAAWKRWAGNSNTHRIQVFFSNCSLPKNGNLQIHTCSTLKNWMRSDLFWFGLENKASHRAHTLSGGAHF